MSKEVKVMYLKKANTPDHQYFIATPALIERAKTLKDLFPYDPVTKQFIALGVGMAKLAPAVPAPEDGPDANVQGKVQTGDDDPLDENRVALAKAAFEGLTEQDWTKATGKIPAMPRVDSLSVLTGFDVTREERDAAFKEWTEDKAGK